MMPKADRSDWPNLQQRAHPGADEISSFLSDVYSYSTNSTYI